MNKKQAAITALLLTLMISLIAFQDVFNDKIFNASTVRDEVVELNKYEIKDQNISYELPSNWTVKKGISDDYILYKVSITDKDGRYRGYLQLIDSNSDINTESVVINNNDSEVKGLEEIELNGYKAIRYILRTPTEKDNSHISISYYIKVDDKTLKVNYLVKEDNFSQEDIEIYDRILSNVNGKDK